MHTTSASRFFGSWLISSNCVRRSFAAIALALPLSANALNVSVLHAFSGGNDGQDPEPRLVQTADGSFFGETLGGGAFGSGTLFKIAPDGSFTTVYTFSGPDGAEPSGGLIVGPDGNLYGVTASGGNYFGSSGWGTGTIFQFDPATGVLTTLYKFPVDGASNPWTALTLGADGSFYGTTLGYNSGPNNFGTVFRWNATVGFTTLHVFTGTDDGSTPRGALLQGVDGSFYGTTYFEGSLGYGTVFKITALGTFETLHAFSGEEDGAYPFAGLTLATDGNFYGTTSGGGTSGYGAVFKITPAGAFSMLYSFRNAEDGAVASPGVIQAADGNLYGATTTGVLYRLTLAGAFTPLHTLISAEGIEPYYNLIQGSDGSLYGATRGGGAGSAGTVFKMAFPRATSIAAKAEILTMSPTAVHLRMKAVLNATNPTQPLAGKTVSFSAPRGPVLCTAVTDNTGTAACGTTITYVRTTINQGYTATFAGDGTYLGSSAFGSLIQ